MRKYIRNLVESVIMATGGMYVSSVGNSFECKKALARQHQVKNELIHLAEVTSWSLVSKTYQPELNESVGVSIDLAAIPEPPPLPEAIEAFWGEFSWTENPWTPDEMVPCLKSKKLQALALLPVRRPGDAKEPINKVGEQYKEKVTVTEERRARAAAKWH
ncbi:uncharacterized protein PITG_20555 [Phytophthora infestans T30-4]|uniref:Uncharacterized protein n=1 Tax=Phytophthora infestans (strain T30-4) TaxID=403677 RepID=D0P2G1_PHYIT|nr:uncharacterized protein PITG_20555 [Phytophthora infestans T30-4]EEY56254.1 hypothetical protein PITG_20555 [Phytophthora infestans T30-4]|eukprot:XP_002895504.1 hypothetical protein PITG_20555 [Phytophthora infestans T30-4]